jgi:hypothetical protein
MTWQLRFKAGSDIETGEDGCLLAIFLFLPLIFFVSKFIWLIRIFKFCENGFSLKNQFYEDIM